MRRIENWSRRKHSSKIDRQKILMVDIKQKYCLHKKLSIALLTLHAVTVSAFFSRSKDTAQRQVPRCKIATWLMLYNSCRSFFFSPLASQQHEIAGEWKKTYLSQGVWDSS